MSGTAENVVERRRYIVETYIVPMPTELIVLFIDTNGFLQMRDLKDIPWREMFPKATRFDLMIAPRVIEELDKFKTSANDRLRTRARSALHLIEDAAASGDLSLLLRTTPFEVRIVIAPGARFDWDSAPTLDPTKPDDQLVAEAIAFGNGAAVFSHDTGPRIRARIARIPAYKPPDNWLLPLEKTNDQRKISQLERDLERALSGTPIIVAGLIGLEDGASEWNLVVPELQPLDAQLIESLTKKYIALNPRAVLRSTRSYTFEVGGFSEGAVQRYYEKYVKFEGEVRTYFSTLHENVSRRGLAVAARYFVKNNGEVTANGLRIEFELEGKGSLLAERDSAREALGSLKPPVPPEEPRSHLEYMQTVFPNHLRTIQDAMEPRDPVAFYWFERPVLGSTNSALQCENFRATRDYRDEIFVLSYHAPPTSLDLCLRVNADNLRSPLDVRAKLLITQQPANWTDDAVRALMPTFLLDLFD